MKKLYVIGPFRAPTPWEVEQNIRRAEEVALYCWRHKYAVFCPHTNSRFFDKTVGVADEHFLEGDIAWMLHADLAVVAPGWQDSEGSVREVYTCDTANIPVYKIGCTLENPLIEISTWVKENAYRQHGLIFESGSHTR